MKTPARASFAAHRARVAEHAAAVTFITRHYELAHGRQPHGDAHWGFCPARYYDEPDYLTHVKWFNGSYPDAKRQAAIAFGVSRDYDVVVCP